MVAMPVYACTAGGGAGGGPGGRGEWCLALAELPCMDARQVIGKGHCVLIVSCSRYGGRYFGLRLQEGQRGGLWGRVAICDTDMASGLWLVVASA